MPTGKGGNLDWKKLMREAELSVISLHTDLGSLERKLRPWHLKPGTWHGQAGDYWDVPV